MPDEPSPTEEKNAITVFDRIFGMVFFSGFGAILFAILTPIFAVWSAVKALFRPRPALVNIDVADDPLMELLWHVVGGAIFGFFIGLWFGWELTKKRRRKNVRPSSS